MQNKLQELTDRLYNEGLSKGKKDAEEMLSKAQGQAEAIVAEAQAKAEKMISDAEKRVAELETKSQNDLKTASRQAITALKQEIENAVLAKSTSLQVSKALNETEFLQKVISTIVKAFNPDSSSAMPLELILSEDMKKDMDTFLKEELGKSLGAELNIRYEKMKSKGFKIGPKGESYIISFTDNDFERLIADYLRPKTREILFG